MKPTPKHDNSGRMLLVDGLRGVAALWVVFFHLYKGEQISELTRVLPPIAWIFGVGTVGVYIFFVLSGFVIAHSVGKHRVDGAFVGRFALRRSLRLDPPYWASMLLVVALAWIRARLQQLEFTAPTLRQGAAHLGYLQDILEIQPISAVYWTLCLEIQFYLIFCVLLWLAGRMKRDPMAVFTPFLLLAAAWPLLGLRSPWPGSFLPFWYGFLSGMLANWAVRRIVPLWIPVAFCATLLLGALRSTLIDGDPAQGFEVGTAAVVALLLLWTGKTGTIRTWLSWRPLQMLGTTSYSLYLIHLEALTVIYFVLRRFIPRTVAGDALAAGLAVLGTVAAAWTMWRLVEVPSLALAKRISMSRVVVDLRAPDMGVVGDRQ